MAGFGNLYVICCVSACAHVSLPRPHKYHSRSTRRGAHLAIVYSLFNLLYDCLRGNNEQKVLSSNARTDKYSFLNLGDFIDCFSQLQMFLDLLNCPDGLFFSKANLYLCYLFIQEYDSFTDKRRRLNELSIFTK